MKRLVIVAVLTTLAAPQSGIAAPGDAPKAMVAQGDLVGKMENGAAAFLGVPFAAPPVGELRWAPPKPALKYASSPRLATKYGASCVQTLSPPPGHAPWSTEYMAPIELGTSEDCLTANIWTPADLSGSSKPRAALPVLFYIYGGGFQEGAASVPVYDGAAMAKKGMVVVNFNYRLGVLGFFASPDLTAENHGVSGNQGIADQIAALKWVHDNIAAFGGDPAKVTIAGQSAGAASVTALLVSPQAKGLFRAAISESVPSVGSNGTYSALAAAEARGTAALQGWGVKSLAEARALPVAKISGGRGGGLVADGAVLPANPNPPFASDVPLMIGYTLNDLFGGRTGAVSAAAWKAEAATRYGERAGEFLTYYPGDTDAQATRSAQYESASRAMLSPMAIWVDKRGGTKPVYGYLFSHVEPGPDAARFGAFHTSEVPYFYGNLYLSPGRDFTATDRNVETQASTFVTNFVKTGNPNGAGLPAWQPLTSQGKLIMDMGDTATPSRTVPAVSEAVIAAGKAPVNPGFPGMPPIAPPPN